MQTYFGRSSCQNQPCLFPKITSKCISYYNGTTWECLLKNFKWRCWQPWSSGYPRYQKKKRWETSNKQLNITPTQNIALRKHAYSNILKISPPKTENFQIKKSDIFHNSAQNIDCGYSLEPPRRGGSNEYPQSMFWAEIRKIMYTPVNPSFTI